MYREQTLMERFFNWNPTNDPRKRKLPWGRHHKGDETRLTLTRLPFIKSSVWVCHPHPVKRQDIKQLFCLFFFFSNPRTNRLLRQATKKKHSFCRTFILENDRELKRPNFLHLLCSHKMMQVFPSFWASLRPSCGTYCQVANLQEQQLQKTLSRRGQSMILPSPECCRTIFCYPTKSLLHQVINNVHLFFFHLSKRMNPKSLIIFFNLHT